MAAATEAPSIALSKVFFMSFLLDVFKGHLDVIVVIVER